MVSDTLEKKEKKYNRIPNVMHLKKTVIVIHQIAMEGYDSKKIINNYLLLKYRFILYKFTF
jgi:hypothetical protein